MTTRRTVRLQYGYDTQAQTGHDVDHPMFAMLSAVQDGGSIQQAARRLGLSYRHLWGQLKNWEVELGEPLVTWVRGQPARLTPFADRLLQAERRARERMAPHIVALRRELEQVFADARGVAVQGSGPDACVGSEPGAGHPIASPADSPMAARSAP